MLGGKRHGRSIKAARALGRGVLRGLILLVRLLPLPAALALGRGLGGLVRLVSRRRYRVAVKNLRIAYGDALTEAERRRIARESFAHFGMFAVEGVKFAWMPRSEVEERIGGAATSYEELCKALECKRGAILVTGHLGNFEIGARWLTGRGHELYALARGARDQGTTDLMRSIRERMGIKVVTLNESLKPALAGLKRNACLAIICDQNASDVFVPFFGHPTGTVDGPARIARRLGTPLLFFTCTRERAGTYRLWCDKPIWPDTAAPESVEVPRLMGEINRALEQAIRRHPEQWLWFHDRWRSSPDVHQEPSEG